MGWRLRLGVFGYLQISLVQCSWIRLSPTRFGILCDFMGRFEQVGEQILHLGDGADGVELSSREFQVLGFLVLVDMILARSQEDSTDESQLAGEGSEDLELPVA